MPVIILLGRSRMYLDELISCLSAHFRVVHLNDEFRVIRGKLSNMDPGTAYIVENCEMKPQRYEIYCLAKRNETSYCILADGELSSSKHDTPLFCVKERLPTKEILDCLEFKLNCSVAHKKKVVGANYLMHLKKIINQVNEEMPEGSRAVLKDCEDKIMRMVKLSPLDLDGIEKVYREIVQSELAERGFDF
ncbi:hypothetical protein KMI_08g13120 [Encephalitozoon hellem]|uniref:Antiterminator n=1 Tax=Encephalitozoon hellem TaxID=27973 RepID=A0A9Q9C4M2_ENCHE|nr:uncharacterized protein EHEL_070890 [Encephalitozoon hellem ATCC 50504]AFM98615.1 hypothetical protein EHEL_070890 [Encephalitozoon hellem ATCC 50504]KAG5859175.1 hypothetical protein KMI_08g13120 [Encephalitozoon hellem]UTX43560.1 putative antiterminator [Encephalitozoon hellem]WEL39035.1 putative antiterminator [Encephalitozoon hellem]|eukprot:XP_003887596.1 hypothetical protein EHEL_070890 [Encephalitozoon hellem ATCC 50504]